VRGGKTLQENPLESKAQRQSSIKFTTSTISQARIPARKAVFLNSHLSFASKSGHISGKKPSDNVKFVIMEMLIVERDADCSSQSIKNNLNCSWAKQSCEQEFKLPLKLTALQIMKYWNSQLQFLQVLALKR